MATAKKAAKTKTQQSEELGNSAPPARKTDPVHPDVDTSRHSADGLQESNLAGIAETSDPGASPVSPLTPLIGANAAPTNPVQPGSAGYDEGRPLHASW